MIHDIWFCVELGKRGKRHFSRVFMTSDHNVLTAGTVLSLLDQLTDGSHNIDENCIRLAVILSDIAKKFWGCAALSI